MRVALSLVFSAAFFASAGRAGAQDLGPTRAPREAWLGPDGTGLPFASDEEIQEFLRTAHVTTKKVLAMGKNRALKVGLERGAVRANAIFRTVDAKREWTQISGKRYRNYHDSHVYEYAAYVLSRVLGIDNVPPCVPRRIDGKEGTLQLWVENAQTLKHRVDSGNPVVTSLPWNRQDQMMRVFDALIHNFDRNQGNMLFDANGKLWFIDHTRSFTVSEEVDGLDQIIWCDRDMWERIQQLDEAQLVDRLFPHIEYARIRSLLKRRDKLVAHIRHLIDTRGVNVVLFDKTSGDTGM